MNVMPLPASFLSEESLELIDSHAGIADIQGYLMEEVVDHIFHEGWFRMLAPKRWGGGGLALPGAVRLEEGLAFADGSVGWMVTLCSGAGWFGGFLPDRIGESVFHDPRLCIAGSGSPTGEAQVVNGGYRVSGNWAYASGIRHATAYTGNCVIFRDGAPLREADGKPVVRAFLFLPGEVRVRDDWQAMGLVATGSHGFSVRDMLIEEERSFIIDATAATDGDVLYRYPFLPLAEATLAANISGMGWRFLDCCQEYFGRRPMPEAMALLERARIELAGTRGEFYHALDRSWQSLEQGVTLPALFETVGEMSHRLASDFRQWVDRLYPYAGLGAAGIYTTINRVWRDLHTAGQHPVLVNGPEARRPKANH